MKTVLLQNRIALSYTMIGFAMLLLMGSPFAVNAQYAVQGVSTHRVAATTGLSYIGTEATGTAASSNPTNSYTYTFGTSTSTAGNNVEILDSLKANGLEYHFDAGAAYKVIFRRVNNTTVTGSRKSFRIEQIPGTLANHGTLSLYPDYNDSLEQVFGQRIFNIGIDNVFQNDPATNNINIERIDVIFPFGVKATDNTKAGFVAFDWGAAGGHDPFYIAAIKTYNPATGLPTAYYNAISATATDYGSNVGSSLTYAILRKNPTDAHLLMMSSNTAQVRDGVFFRFADLGVANNTYIWGYSIFAPDVNVTSAANLVDYTNGTNFPTTTNLGGGGYDPLAVGGLWVINTNNVVLPSQVGDLYTSTINNQVKLSWDLLSTDGLSDQVVERSGDGVNYTTLLHVPVQATGAQTAIDANPLNGKNYYRLKLVQQNNATAAYSAISWVDLKATASLSMEVYPNPVTSHQLTLAIHGLSNAPYKIIVLDMNGRPLLTQAITGEQQVQATVHLPAGIPTGTYVVKLTDNAGNRILDRQVVVK